MELIWRKEDEKGFATQTNLKNMADIAARAISVISHVAYIVVCCCYC